MADAAKKFRVYTTICFILLCVPVLFPLTDSENRGTMEFVLRIGAAAFLLMVAFLPLSRGRNGGEP